jgi:hypothetical protein
MSQSSDDSVILVPYYCHKCQQEVDSIFTDTTCSKCNSGFIQEVEDKDTNAFVDNQVSKESKVNIKEESVSICSICLESNKNDENVSEKLICGHLYHKDCISQWLKNNTTCPLCRVTVTVLKPTFTALRGVRIVIEQIVFSPSMVRSPEPINLTTSGRRLSLSELNVARRGRRLLGARRNSRTSDLRLE